MHGPPSDSVDSSRKRIMKRPSKQTWGEIILIGFGLVLIILPQILTLIDLPIIDVHISVAWAKTVVFILQGVGIALFTAGGLALMVDRPLKAQIARAAFKEIMGWATPERLQDELERVYEVPFIAIEHRMTIDLSEPQNGITRMRLNIVRKLKNESLRKQKIRPSIAVRRWQDTRRDSGVIEISASEKGKPAFRGHEPIEEEDTAAIDLMRSQLSKEFTLDKKEELTVTYRGYEDKLQDDVHFEVFTYPSVNPIVIVNHPPSLAVYVQFNSRGETVAMGAGHLGDGRISSQWNLNGTMLPMQPIIVRWWMKDEPYTPNSE